VTGLTVLIVGGYGMFGGRIVQLLEDEPRLTLIVAGRSLERATRFCEQRGAAAARLTPAGFDRAADVRGQLAGLRPDVMVDASGPFLAYGAQPYRLLEACIAEGVNYLDLADGSDFVRGVGVLDGAARAAGVFALSGVSSFPVLTAAVARRLAADLSRIDSLRGGIAPSPYAGVGDNVIRAIAGYAGRAVPIRRDGQTSRARPFTEQIRYTIAPPGRLPLRNTLFSLVDVPDLTALAEAWPLAQRVWMGAGPVPEPLHRLLISCAWLVRLRLAPTLAPLAPLMAWVARRLRWGEHRGGMFVEVEGVDAGGAPIRRSWHLLAEGDDGPLIPSMAVEAIVRRALRGRPPAPGARACLHDLELADYEALFARRAIRTGVRTDAPADAGPLYRRILGDAWRELPAAVRAMHDGARAAQGEASVERGRGLLAGLAGAVLGFPRAAASTPLTVRFEAAGGAETWTRRFGTGRFASRQFAGRGRSDRLLCEQFGPLTFAMALVQDGARLNLVLRRWTAFGVPLPMWLCPRSEAYETEVDGVFRFHVEISHPLAGLIVRYRGALTPAAG